MIILSFTPNNFIKNADKYNIVFLSKDVRKCIQNLVFVDDFEYYIYSITLTI